MGRDTLASHLDPPATMGRGVAASHLDSPNMDMCVWAMPNAVWGMVVAGPQQLSGQGALLNSSTLLLLLLLLLPNSTYLRQAGGGGAPALSPQQLRM